MAFSSIFNNDAEYVHTECVSYHKIVRLCKIYVSWLKFSSINYTACVQMACLEYKVEVLQCNDYGFIVAL